MGRGKGKEIGDMRDKFIGRRHGTKMQEDRLLITRGQCAWEGRSRKQIIVFQVGGIAWP